MLNPFTGLCSTPVAPRPDGSPPNFVNPPSLQIAAYAIGLFVTGLAIIIAAGRFWAHRNVLKASDYVALIGIIFNLVNVGITLSLSKTFRHDYDTPLCWYSARSLKLSFAIDMLAAPILFFTKASIFLFYIELFSVDRTVRIGSWTGIIASLFLFFPPILTLAWFDSPHIGESWEALLINGRPRRGIPAGIFVGVASVLMDIYLFALPVRTILQLKLTSEKRFQLLGLFGTAAFGIIASVLGLVYRVELFIGHDFSWDAGSAEITVIVENNVAIIVGCLPGFLKFLRSSVFNTRLGKSILSNFSRGSDKSKPRRTTNSSLNQFRRKDMWPYTSPRNPERPYYELSKSRNVGVSISAPGRIAPSGIQNNAGIMRTVEFSQHVHSEPFA